MEDLHVKGLARITGAAWLAPESCLNLVMTMDTSRAAVSPGYGARAAENESHCASGGREAI